MVEMKAVILPEVSGMLAYGPHLESQVPTLKATSEAAFRGFAPRFLVEPAHI